jgi:hypothetical protein
MSAVYIDGKLNHHDILGSAAEGHHPQAKCSFAVYVVKAACRMWMPLLLFFSGIARAKNSDKEVHKFRLRKAFHNCCRSMEKNLWVAFILCIVKSTWMRSLQWARRRDLVQQRGVQSSRPRGEKGILSTRRESSDAASIINRIYLQSQYGPLTR